jgi:hypothetical protein
MCDSVLYIVTISGALSQSRKVPISFAMSVRLPTCISKAPTGRIFAKFDIGHFYENLPLEGETKFTACLWQYGHVTLYSCLHRKITSPPAIFYQFPDSHSLLDPTSSCFILQYLIDSSRRACGLSGKDLEFVFKSFHLRPFYLIFRPGFLYVT